MYMYFTSFVSMVVLTTKTGWPESLHNRQIVLTKKNIQGILNIYDILSDFFDALPKIAIFLRAPLAGLYNHYVSCLLSSNDWICEWQRLSPALPVPPAPLQGRGRRPVLAINHSRLYRSTKHIPGQVKQAFLRLYMFTKVLVCLMVQEVYPFPS